MKWMSLEGTNGNILNFAFVEETGMFHWEGDPSYCGYTREELLEMGAEE